MALRIGSSQNRNLYVGTGTEVAVSDGNAIVTGNVGIGTTSPNAPLEIFQGGSGKVTLLQLARPNTAGLQSNIQFTVGSNIMVGQIQHEYAGANFNHMSFTLRAVNGNDIIPLWLENSGKVGIGTTSPNGKLTILEAQGTNKGDFDFQQIVYNGGWSANVDGLAAIQWSDGVGSSNTVGRIGVTYTGSQGEFQIKDLFNGGYAGSGKVFTVRGDGQAYFSGKVGIGTTSPGNMLDVAGDTDITGQLVVNHDSNYVVKINQQATSMSNGSYTFEVNSSTHTSNMSTAGAMAVDVNSGRAFTINGLGKVGIATINPDKDLTVGGTGPTHGINLRTKSGSNEWLLWQVEQFFSQEAYMRLFYDNVAKIQFRANGDSYFAGGKVGIGKTNPGNMLDVAGDTDIAGQLVVNHNSNYVVKINQQATSMSNGSYTLEVNSSTHTSNMSSAGAMAVDVNAGRAFTINGLGSVGINTSSPNAKLAVRGDIALVGEGVGNCGVRYIKYDCPDATTVNAIAITSAGNVGIGQTPASDAKLEVWNGNLRVRGDQNAFIALSNTSGNTKSQLGNAGNEGDLSLYTSGNAKTVYLSSYYDSYINPQGGDLGIGTTNPGAKLDVNGSINTSGSINLQALV